MFFCALCLLYQHDAYDKLRKSLDNEVNEEAWNILHSTRSFPFTQPLTSKIVIKVTNHYGNEALKVYPITAKGKK